ncbi:MAG: hypothetical protein ABI162_15385 [Luteolibacter sp.]
MFDSNSNSPQSPLGGTRLSGLPDGDQEPRVSIEELLQAIPTPLAITATGETSMTGWVSHNRSYVPEIHWWIRDIDMDASELSLELNKGLSDHHKNVPLWGRFLDARESSQTSAYGRFLDLFFEMLVSREMEIPMDLEDLLVAVDLFIQKPELLAPDLPADLHRWIKSIDGVIEYRGVPGDDMFVTIARLFRDPCFHPDTSIPTS